MSVYICAQCGRGDHSTHGFGCLSADCGCEVELPTLDSAWSRVEAALPEGSVIDSLLRVPTDGKWVVQATNDPLGPDGDWWGTEGPTPTAALLALAESLEARKP